MPDTKSEYRNPLTVRLAESIALLESLAVELIQRNQPHYIITGKRILGMLSPIFDVAKDVDKFLQSIGVNTDTGQEEKAVLLLKSILEDVYQLVSEWEERLKNKDLDLNHTNDEPVTKYELVNITEDAVKVSELLIEALDDPDLINLINLIIPDDLEFDTVGEREKFKEYVHSYQKSLRKQVNEIVPDYLFQLIGEFWEIRFGGKIIHLKDSKGLQYINTLLKNPHKPIRADSLAAPQTSDNKHPSNHFDKVSESESLGYFDNSNKTYKEMTNKIMELENILEELVPGSDDYYLAEEHLKTKRKERSRIFNRSGQERPQDSGEKARQAVLNAIKTAKGKIKKDLPDLFMHIERYLDTGFECIYDPLPGEETNWQF